MMPMMLLLLDRSALAAMLGWYPSSLAAMRTFFATPSLTDITGLLRTDIPLVYAYSYTKNPGDYMVT